MTVMTPIFKNNLTSYLIQFTFHSFKITMMNFKMQSQGVVNSRSLLYVLVKFPSQWLTKAGLNMIVGFSAAKYGSKRTSRSRFKQYKDSMLVPQFYVSGCFYKCLSVFWVYSGRIIPSLIKLLKIPFNFKLSCPFNKLKAHIRNKNERDKLE